MANINLLPWREERRDEKKKEFFVWLIAAAALAALAVVGVNSYFSKQISDAKKDNQTLQAGIDELNKKAKILDDLKAEREALMKRMRVIQSLEGERPRIVHVFDQLVRILPEGVFLKDLQREGEKLVIKGTAETNNYVSNLMRKLKSSEWFVNPNLIEVKANPTFGEQANDFEMTVSLSKPKTDDESAKASENKNG